MSNTYNYVADYTDNDGNDQCDNPIDDDNDDDDDDDEFDFEAACSRAIVARNRLEKEEFLQVCTYTYIYVRMYLYISYIARVVYKVLPL